MPSKELVMPVKARFVVVALVVVAFVAISLEKVSMPEKLLLSASKVVEAAVMLLQPNFPAPL